MAVWAHLNGGEEERRGRGEGRIRSERREYSGEERQNKAGAVSWIQIIIKTRCEIIIRNICREKVIVPRVHDMIVLVDSSEPFIGEHRGDGGQVGG
jgi:hypothetical protein